ncbi:putative ORFan [Tupanvirus deep ocean]|uniref:ORFan n=2 Tax=Tupanvirus TaxID=2094720 RepID=A0AC62A7V2_9VIRU|nr:putative ORFan [Tupanvirus deep ocean]QKU33856.1 putative ORFan [Tupanvirus deep ocean]
MLILNTAPLEVFGVDDAYFLLCHVSGGASLSLSEQGKKIMHHQIPNVEGNNSKNLLYFT